MSKYEYQVITSVADDETDQELLNEWGADGWELVSAVEAERDFGPDEGGKQLCAVFYLKRPFVPTECIPAAEPEGAVE